MADVTFWFLPSELSAPGLFRSLTPFIESDPAFDPADFYPGMLGSFHWGDDTWALPVYGYPFLIGYDRDAFDEADLPYPRAGWTQEDFGLAAQQLTQRDGDEILRYGYVDCSEWPVARAFVEGQAGPLVDIRTTPPSPRLNAPDVTRAVSWYADLALQDGAMPGGADLDAMRLSGEPDSRGACMRLIREGRVAMWADASRVQDVQPPGRNQGIVPFPTAEHPANPWFLYSYAMSRGTRSPQESWLWLYFVARQNGQAQGDINPFGFVPASRPFAGSSDFWSAWDAEVQDAMRGAMAHAWAVRLDGATTALEGAIDDILAGKPVRTALDEAQIEAMSGR
jgi:multiple sugar transport system substrate-binding protein